MVELAVTGYASLDYPVLLDGMVQGDRTTHIRFRDAGAWPRAGGSPTYVAQSAVAAGLSAAPIVWIGEDAPGADYLDHCRRARLNTSGIARRQGARSPAAVMIHQTDGTTACLYDPAFEGEEALSDVQAALIAQCAMLCVTVGPGHLIGDILAHRPATKPLCWVMKDDPACFGPANRARLVDRANLIFCNASERRLIGDPPRAETIIVETLGADGVRLHYAGTKTELAADAVDVSDPTGAGDSFAGAFIAAHMQGAEPRVAAHSAMAAVSAMLRARAALEAAQ